MENPNPRKAAKVPTRETGTTSMGTSMALKFPRKMNTTSMTSPRALNRVKTTSVRAARTKRVLS